MELIDFIIEAKINGYATGGEGNEMDFSDGYKGFRFQKENFSYIDRFVGFNPFTGYESVFQKGSKKPVWIMNYFGMSYLSVQDSKPIYDFLKIAMMQIDHSHPFRGPEVFTEENWTYQNEQQGEIAIFSGIEKIFHGRDEVYRLYYHGGLLNR